MEETKEDKLRQTRTWLNTKMRTLTCQKSKNLSSASRLQVIQYMMESGWVDRDKARILLDMDLCFSLDEYLKIRDTGLYKLAED